MKKLILLILLIIIFSPVYAAETDRNDSLLQIPDIDNKVISVITFESLTNTLNNVNINSENSLEGIQKATERYTQTNVVAAYKDFSKIINSINGKNDFLYVTMAQRLAGLGFFTLSQNSIINISDTELWYNPVKALKDLYSPAVTLTYDEEIYLAKIQTDILYNNSAKEAIKILEDNDKLLKKSDYANYILSVGYFENKNYLKAMNSINKAISKAPNCLNYLHFKEKIYSQSGNYKAALKIINKLEKSALISNYYKDYLNNDRLYILMKTSKKDEAKYYSAKLFFNTGEYQKALKDAQSAVSLNKKNIDAHILLGDYYLKFNEPEKAFEYYNKAYNLKPKYSDALISLGHYYFAKKEYDSAYEYYLKAYKYSSQNDKILVCLANCLIAQKDYNHAADYLKKALKINPDSDTAYYLMSKIYPKLKEQYLRKAISVNPVNEYAWLDLAELKILQNNFNEANEYIIPVALISPNNQRYLLLKRIINSKNKDILKSSSNITESNFDLMFN